MRPEKKGFQGATWHSLYLLLLIFVGLVCVLLLSGGEAKASSETGTPTVTPNAAPETCQCDVKLVRPSAHQDDVSLTCNADGTVHWAATLLNKPQRDDNPGCALMVPYQIALQVHCTDASNCTGGQSNGWVTVQTQRGTAVLPNRTQITLQGDFCYHWQDNKTDKLRYQFSFDTGNPECSKKKKSGDIPICRTNPPCAPQFPDVPSSNVYYTVISGLSTWGVISGYEDGMFKPDSPTYRAQLAKMVVLAFGMGVQTRLGGRFNDIPGDHPYFAYIEAAYAHGLIDGYGDGSFRPYNNVTRGQVAKIIVQAAGLRLIEPHKPSFTDVSPGSTFYTYIETARANGILSGYPDGTFKPDAHATRGQICKVTYLAAVSREE